MDMRTTARMYNIYIYISGSKVRTPPTLRRHVCIIYLRGVARLQTARLFFKRGGMQNNQRVTVVKPTITDSGPDDATLPLVRRTTKRSRNNRSPTAS